jgi:hypothetical protein
MKGDVYRIGEVLKISGTEHAQFNGMHCHVIAIIKTEPHECPVYRVKLDDGNVFTSCVCFLNRVAPMIQSEWSQKIPWSQCSWKPGMKRMSQPAFAELLRLIKVSQSKRKAKK